MLLGHMDHEVFCSDISPRLLTSLAVNQFRAPGTNRVKAKLLGEFVEGDLRYVGQVGSPPDSRVMRAVARLLSPRAITPFRDAISDSLRLAEGFVQVIG